MAIWKQTKVYNNNENKEAAVTLVESLNMNLIMLSAIILFKNYSKQKEEIKEFIQLFERMNFNRS